MKSRHPLSVSDLPSHRVLAGLLACGLAASGPLSADVIADFNVIGARTINTAPGLYPAVTAEERRTFLGSDLAPGRLASY